MNDKQIHDRNIFNIIIFTHIIHIQCIDVIGIIRDKKNTRGKLTSRRFK